VRERLLGVRAETELRKREHDAQAMDVLLRRMREVSGGLERLTQRVERSGRAFAANVSNVHGPDRPLSVLGAQVESLYSLAELAEHHALRVAVVSAGGMLNFGLCSDPAAVDDVEVIARGIAEDAAGLVARGGGSAQGENSPPHLP
jgi:hypothetical protein